jgi:hypothetical protein
MTVAASAPDRFSQQSADSSCTLLIDGHPALLAWPFSFSCGLEKFIEYRKSYFLAVYILINANHGNKNLFMI